MVRAHRAVSLRLAALGAFAVACGCSTTVSTIEGAAAGDAIERTALAAAAGELATPAGWTGLALSDDLGLAPRSAAISPAKAMGGLDEDAAAVGRAYAAALSDAEAPLAILTGDADGALDAAVRFIAAADEAFAEHAPTLDDVALVEEAIQATRFRKLALLQAVELVPARAVDRQIAEVSIRGQFDAAALALSSMADEIALIAVRARFSEAGLGPTPPRTAGVDGDADAAGVSN